MMLITMFVGDIIVFIPDGFCGAILSRSKRLARAVDFLPAFSARARVIKGDDQESFVLVGNSDAALKDPKNTTLDLCFLTTQSGKITIGVTGVDHYEEPEQPAGFWKRFMASLSERKSTISVTAGSAESLDDL